MMCTNNIPKVAIVTPVYNTGRYLSDFFESLLSQTFKNFEVYLVNDGSTDNSYQILKEYSQRDSRFFVFHTKNSGASAARNIALDLIISSNKNYDYIYFLDSDDKVSPTALEKVVLALTTNDADYAIFNSLHFDKTTVIQSSNSNSQPIVVLDSDEIVKQYFKIGPEWKKHASSEYFLNNKIFRLSRIKDYRFDENLRRSGDFGFFLKILPELNKGVLVPDAWFYYRLRKSSITITIKTTGDLQACMAIWDELPKRSVIEQKAIQRRLLHAFYKDIALSSSVKDIVKLRYLLSEYKKTKWYQPWQVHDLKYVLVLALPEPLLQLYFKFRKSNHNQQKSLSNYFE